MSWFKNNEKQVQTENTKDYYYILEWANRNRHFNDVLSLFGFIYRNDPQGREEPLKTAWESLTELDKIQLTYDLAKLYKERSLSN